MREVEHGRDRGSAAERKSIAARVGVTALNLLSPGLGLVRVGDWRRGIFFLVSPIVLATLLTFGLGHLPIRNYVAAVSALAAVLGLVVAIYVVPMVLTWHESIGRRRLFWWSRCYSLVAIAIVMLGLGQLAPAMMHRFYKPFYAPSVSMVPTIGKGDKFVVDMRWRGPLIRGAVIVFQAGDAVRVSRIAGLPGDRIAMKGGVPMIDGKPIIQRRHGRQVFPDYSGPSQGTVLIERFPGERSTHAVLDAGPSYYDDMFEVLVPPEHIFVLSDNRDRAADSRVPQPCSAPAWYPCPR